MKQNIISILASIVIGVSAVSALDNYRVKPKTVIPSQHTWIFTDKEVGKILVGYLKSLGTNVPDGKIFLAGMENHFDFGNNPRIELTIVEKNP
jgi:hypothetical protein